MVISVFIDFLSNSKRVFSFHFIAYDYSPVDYDGLCDHLEDIFGRISLKLVFLLLLVNFVSGLRLELICIYIYILFIYIILYIYIYIYYIYIHI